MTYKTAFVVETRLPLGADIESTEVSVVIPGKYPVDLQNRLEAMPDLVSQARKNIASRYVSFEAYSNDSAYLDALDRVADGVEIVSIKEKAPEGIKPFRIYFEAEYENDAGIWGQEAWGINKEDAVFQGAWDMAVKNGYDGKRENIEDLLYFMDVKVLMQYAKPVSETELIDLLGRLVSASVSGDDLAEVASEARAAIEAIAANQQDMQWLEAAQAALDHIEGKAPTAAPGM